MRRKTPAHRKRRHSTRRDLKDRLIQTRVPESLENKLKKEASRRRLSVSHLIRNVLEDTFDLVGGVVAEVDNIVQDSVGLADQVRRDAGRIAGRAFENVRSRGASGIDLETGDGEQTGWDGYDRENGAEPVTTSTAAGRAGGAGTEGRKPVRDGAEPVTTRTAAGRADGAGTEGRKPVQVEDEANLDHILAWNPVVMNRDGECARCGVALRKGESSLLGISQTPGSAPTWLCDRCVASL